ncbi:hypothetical protein N7520_000857 [Penicillium odoratum]|uniref:uncharacterized protein n=1 Tax=Penicillium odoratum TaxID=1167516 RepID=UPI002546B42D|nr:uncharacterized protein N7520_000857 [Penicillium odoratum]KAJ5777611.1 hypothetical protein N7520_000857 [Penicillium odoratum]
MAAVDPPAGLMDITSTIPQDEIPMKLRCAICNMLAVNAFRLPCCDQSICETCQSSLVDTCPVCAHTPVSPDLCKPNKALRTTLKAYLRTEEKKREKERQAAAASTPAVSTPAESENVPTDIPVDQPTTEPTPAHTPEVPAAKETAPDEPTQETEDVVITETAKGNTTLKFQTLSDEHAELAGDQITDPSNPGANAPQTDGDRAISDELAQETSQEAAPSAMNMGGGFPGMGWNGNGNFNGMNPFMANPMFFSNPMGMPMGMDPMANQGMFGDYGMNMTGMGMNGMNFEGQGMYGSLGWDSQQNMWQGGQDKFNPNAFPNGSGPPYGGAFGGPNMSYPNDFQSGYNGPGYGRGGFRGRGRGHFYGPGRGGYGPGQGHYSHTNHGLPNRPGSSASGGPSVAIDTEVPQDPENSGAANAVAINDNEAVSADPASADDQQLQGIPTIDSLDQALPSGPGGYQGAMGPGYGRGGYMRGSMPHGRGGYWSGHLSQSHIEPRNPGVEGAPAAPRAMRQGLPNTSVLRQRGGFHQARPSVGSTAAPTNSDPNTPPVIRELSQAPSQPRRASRSPSPPPKQASRAPSPSAPATDDGREGRRDRDARRLTDHRTRSPSGVSSRRSSRPRHRDSDRERRSGHRSHRSRRHRTRSRSRSLSRSTNRNGDSRQPDRLTAITQDQQNSHFKSSGKINPRDLATRIGNSHRTSRDRPSRREEDRERDRPRDSRRGEHDKDRGRDRRDRDRGDRADQPDRERERDRRREKERDRERDRDRGRDREKDRKRSRRDRSESANASDSHPRSRRVKRETDDRKDREAESVPEPEKDPHTLEREARNRERLQREQQRREQAKSGNRRDSRQERAVAGRRTNYKYEDEL